MAAVYTWTNYTNTGLLNDEFATIVYFDGGRTRIPAGTDTVTGQSGAITEINSSGVTLDAEVASTITASNLIPARVLLLGVSGRVTTTFTGATSFHVGDGSDTDLWGANVSVDSGSTFDTDDATADPQGTWSASSRSVTLTAVGGNFTSTGSIELIAHYLKTCAATG